MKFNINPCKLVLPKRKYFVVLGGFLLNLTIGNVYTFGNMGPYFVKYLNTNDSKTPHNQTSLGEVVWIFSLSIFGLGSSISLGGFISRIFGCIPTMLCGGFLMSVTVLLMFFLLDTSLGLIVFVYGFISGVGSGIVYGVAIGTACKWFPGKQGAISGFIVSGFGLSAFVFDLIQSTFIESKSIEKDENERIRMSFLLVGSIYVILQIIGTALMKEKPKMDDTDPVSLFRNVFNKDSSYQPAIEIKPYLMLMELDFWVMWISYVLLTACFILVIALHKSYGQMLQIPSRHLNYIAAVGACCNALGRIFWGWVVDRHPYKNVMLTMCLSLAVFLGTFPLGYAISSIRQSPTIFYIFWVMFLHFIPAGIFSIFPKMCSKLFGGNHFIGNYGVLFTAYSVGGLITSAITTVIWSSLTSSDAPKTFMISFITGCVISLIAAAVTLFFRGRSLLLSSRLI